jgi:hypothetical protein
LDDAATVVAGLLPGLPADRAAAAVAAVTVGGLERLRPPRHRAITGWLRAHPDALTSGASTAPLDVARLIDQLRAAGRGDVVAPRCADCGRTRLLRATSEAGRICHSCDSRRRVEPCHRCGRVERVCTRDDQRQPVCERCRRADPVAWRPCERCGTVGPYRGTVNGRRLGPCCYLRPHERCTVCGVGRAVYLYKTRRAVCADCQSAPRVACVECGLDAPPATDGQPARCQRCRLGVTGRCTGCAAPTVVRATDGTPRCFDCYQRPSRPCGRCGRTAVIARRATGGDPELCASCWQGPTVECDSCGRLRPCRGQRTGRQVCKSCRGVRRVECISCGHVRRPVLRRPDGPICESCYRTLMSAKGDCPGCGERRRLLTRHGIREPVCASCADAQPGGPVCGACGDETWLYERRRCSRCVLAERLTALLGDADQRHRIGLEPLYIALTRAEIPETVLGWITRPRPAVLLARIGSGDLACTHDALDALAPSTTARFLDDLLTAVGVLPERDINLARLERWITKFVDGMADPADRQLLRRYATWNLLRHARANSQKVPLTPGMLHAPKRPLRAAADLLAWLHDRGWTLDGCRQADLDDWLATGPAQRRTARSFYQWAATRGHAPPLDFPAETHNRRGLPITDDERWATARRVLHDPDVEVIDRVAGALVVLYGQTVTKISRLTVDDVTITGDHTSIQLGITAIDVGEPLATHVRQLIGARRWPAAAHIPGPPPWLFPGAPGRSISPNHLARRLRALGVDTASRRAALLQLCGELPAAVIADLLGVHIGTAIAWSRAAGRPWPTTSPPARIGPLRLNNSYRRRGFRRQRDNGGPHALRTRWCRRISLACAVTRAICELARRAT